MQHDEKTPDLFHPPGPFHQDPLCNKHTTNCIHDSQLATENNQEPKTDEVPYDPEFFPKEKEIKQINLTKLK